MRYNEILFNEDTEPEKSQPKNIPRHLKIPLERQAIKYFSNVGTEVGAQRA